LFALINAELGPARARYEQLMADGDFIERELQKGALKARGYAAALLKKVRNAVGIAPISS
jgi:tryptophanyl-tRNA synthetase